MTRWQRTPRKLRESVIANLTCDADSWESSDGEWWSEGDERERARATRAAIAALRAAARGGR